MQSVFGLVARGVEGGSGKEERCIWMGRCCDGKLATEARVSGLELALDS
jgi:hypothetical protein